jgi:branched-chain amino acid transport system ATP-binding protein
MTAYGLEARRLSRRFGGLVALSNVDFSVRPEEIVAVIGPNGAGKTTLFNVLTGRLRPTAGQVLLNGVDITRYSERDRIRNGMASTFQVPRLLGDLTVIEVVRVAIANGANRSSVLDAAALCLDLGLHPTKRCATLDLHELKKFELCRALALAPTVLLLDEVAAGLDDGERSTVVDIVRRVAARGTAVIVVEHSMDFVRKLCQRAVVLSFGSVLAAGTVETVLRSTEVMEAYVGMNDTDATA